MRSARPRRRPPPPASAPPRSTGTPCFSRWPRSPRWPPAGNPGRPGRAPPSARPPCPGRPARRRPCRRAGSGLPAAVWLLPKASSKLASMPITSPVERISGPEHGVDLGEAVERQHRLLHRDVAVGSPARPAGPRPAARPGWPRASPGLPPWPAARRSPWPRTAPCGWPAGWPRSRTTWACFTANCTLRRPWTCKASAIARVWPSSTLDDQRRQRRRRDGAGGVA